MSQLFPFLVGGTLNLKEIVSNKDLVIQALQNLALKMETKSFVSDNGKLYSTDNLQLQGQLVFEDRVKLWKWFSDNFLSLTFVKGEVYGLQENPIHTTILVATAVTKLYSRFRIASSFTDEQQDAIHSLKHKFDMWMCDGRNNNEFTISLEEVALMQQILLGWNSMKGFVVFNNENPSHFWIANTVSRIDNNIQCCLSYLQTLV